MAFNLTKERKAMYSIRTVKKTDLMQLSVIYKDLYNNSILNENWSINAAYDLLCFYYDMQPDIFLVAEIEGKTVGAVMSLIKPWFDGKRLIETEVFVSKDQQHRGIASGLFREHFRIAMDLYSVKTIDTHTYQEENGYPLKWYEKQGYKKLDKFYIINGDIQHVYDYLIKHE